jgi:ubiquinone/menaquinone biosynthesis C-methylase UbiE
MIFVSASDQFSVGCVMVDGLESTTKRSFGVGRAKSQQKEERIAGMKRFWPFVQSFFERWFVERVLIRRRVERLYLIMGGHIYFQTLVAAVDLGVFTLLAEKGPSTREELAQTLGCAPKGLRILLLGLTTLGLIRKSGPRYRIAPFAKRVFAGRDAGTIVPVIQWQNQINYLALRHFTEAIRTGRNVGLSEFQGDEPTLYERLAHEPKLEKVFQEAMEGISVQANAMLAKFVNFRRVRYLLDVGGGNGTNIIALARQYPQLKASVFDSPSVCRIASDHIASEGLKDRLSALAGNCFSDPFPADVDCLLFCHFFTIWSEEQNQRLLQKCFESLPAGGTAIIFNMMQHDSEDGPYSAAMASPYFLTLATGQGMLYTWREYEEWMRAAGFHSVETHRLPRDHGVIVGIKT